MSTVFRVDIREKTDLTGYLVIDSLVNGRCYGGLRIAPNISIESLTQAARTMTLKYSFVGLPFGGAKAGIIADPEMPLGEKRELLKNFGGAVKPILQTRTYIPGGDLGTTDDDLSYMLTGNGIRVLPRSLRYVEAGIYAGLTVYTAAIIAADHISLDLSRASVAIEGFGNVGCSVAQSFWERGVKVVAISTSRGAIYANEGLDIEELTRLRDQVGSNVVNSFPKAEFIDKHRLHELPVDILCPCAEPHSITSENASQIKARIISPGANAHTTPEAEQILFKKRVLSLPDFVANCGGILAATMKRGGLSDGFIRQFISHKFGQRVSSIIKAAEIEGIPMKTYAERATEERFLNIKERAERRTIASRAFNFILEIYRRGVVPPQLVKPFIARRFNSEFE